MKFLRQGNAMNFLQGTSRVGKTNIAPINLSAIKNFTSVVIFDKKGENTQALPGNRLQDEIFFESHFMRDETKGRSFFSAISGEGHNR